MAFHHIYVTEAWILSRNLCAAEWKKIPGNGKRPVDDFSDYYQNISREEKAVCHNAQLIYPIFLKLFLEL
jgi:hypothetical protein